MTGPAGIPVQKPRISNFQNSCIWLLGIKIFSFFVNLLKFLSLTDLRELLTLFIKLNEIPKINRCFSTWSLKTMHLVHRHQIFFLTKALFQKCTNTRPASRFQNISYSFAFIRSQSLVTFKHPIFKLNLKLSEIFFSKFLNLLFPFSISYS